MTSSSDKPSLDDLAGYIGACLGTSDDRRIAALLWLVDFESEQRRGEALTGLRWQWSPTGPSSTERVFRAWRASTRTRGFVASIGREPNVWATPPGVDDVLKRFGSADVDELLAEVERLWPQGGRKESPEGADPDALNELRVALRARAERRASASAPPPGRFDEVWRVARAAEAEMDRVHALDSTAEVDVQPGQLPTGGD